MKIFKKFSGIGENSIVGWVLTLYMTNLTLITYTT